MKKGEVNKKIFILSLVLVLTLSIGMVSAWTFGDLFKKMTGAATREGNPEQCTIDSDVTHANPQYIAGYTKVGANYNKDSCASGSLSEATCVGSGRVAYTCPNQCEKVDLNAGGQLILDVARCKSSCTDSDGKNINVQGSVTGFDPEGNVIDQTDKCVDNSKVLEFYCEKNNEDRWDSNKVILACPEGKVCSDGACKCENTCTLNQKRCKNNKVEICANVNGCRGWKLDENCGPLKKCVVDKCVMNQPQQQCQQNTGCNQGTVGNTDCVNSKTSKICEFNTQSGCYAWRTVSCNEDSSCVSSACVKNENFCVGACKLTDPKKCVVLKTTDSTSYGLMGCAPDDKTGCLNMQLIKTCNQGQGCANGFCTGSGGDVTPCKNQCKPGSQQCAPIPSTTAGTREVQTCSKNDAGCYTWQTDSMCPDGTTCGKVSKSKVRCCGNPITSADSTTTARGGGSANPRDDFTGSDHQVPRA